MATKNFKQFFAFFVLCVSMSMLNVALPRFRAAFHYFPVDTAVERMNGKQVVTREKIPYLTGRGKESIDLNDNARYWEDLAAIKLNQLQSEDIFSNSAQVILRQGQANIEQSLFRSPANSYLWYKLASVSFLQQAASAAIADALLMSIMTGPYETGVMLDRLRLCFMVFSEFKKDGRDLLVAQVIRAWNAAPKDFLTIIANERKNRIFLVLLLKDNHPWILNDMVVSFEKTG